jgi:hypothetical protein
MKFTTGSVSGLRAAVRVGKGDRKPMDVATTVDGGMPA